MTTAQLSAALDRLPRVPLAVLPTPLERAPRLSRALGINLLIKRDDLTGLAMGGNKARKLEYLVGDAVAQGATLLLTTAPAQSNFARMTAAAGRRAGVPVALLLRGDPSEPAQGNLLLDRLLGAAVRFVDNPDPYAAVHRELLQAWADEERARGGHPYPIYLHDGSRQGALAAAGYVQAAAELGAQCAAGGVRPDHLYVAVGSGGTLAGLLFGARQPGNPLAVTRLAGICVSALSETVGPQIAKCLAATAGLLDVAAPDEAPLLDDSQRGPGYAVATPAALDAIALAAETEALLLNPVYTGKAFAALRADIARGVVRPGETVVFLNTGGDPLLFRHAETLSGIAAWRDAAEGHGTNERLPQGGAANDGWRMTWTR